MKIYLIIINIISFFIYFTKIDFLITIITILGGSIGELVNLILFDRRFTKENMMNKILIIATFIIQIILLILLNKKTINFNPELLNNKFFLIYLILINLITFLIFYLDKQRAIKNKWRFKITSLLSLCLLGGEIGAISSMYIFNHKTNVNYFTKGIPLIMIVHFLILLLLMNI